MRSRIRVYTLTERQECHRVSRESANHSDTRRYREDLLRSASAFEGGMIGCVGARHAAPLPEVKVIEVRKANVHAALAESKLIH
jgi:hypothetical protein